MDLIGLDTAYEILDTMYKQGRDRLHAPSPILKQMVTAGLLGRKSGRGFYTYAEPGSPGRRRRRDSRRPGPRRPRLRPAGATVGRGRLGHHGHRHHRGLRQGRLRRHLRGAQPEKVAAVQARPSTRACEKAGPARQARRATSATPRSPGSPARRASTTSPTVDLVVEAVVEELSVKQALFENLDEICKPGAILATTTSSLPGDRVRRGHPPPARRHRHALLQPGAGHAARRGRLDGLDRPPTSPRRSRALCRRARQAPGGVRRPGRLHRQRAAVPLPQRRGADARGPLRRRPTTSTPR